MNDRQANKTDDKSRASWSRESIVPGKMKHVRGAWYASDTREPIRDETLRSGLIPLGAVVERTDLATTSAKPRYALAKDFGVLLQELVKGNKDTKALLRTWQESHLTAAARSRINLLRRGTVHSTTSGRIQIKFPNGETRLMRAGPSTTIAKAVIEEFTTAFLREPGVIFLSESGDKVVARDDDLAKSIGLHLDYALHLPDVILADVVTAAPKLVFVEIVATDGPINEQRKRALLNFATEAGFSISNTFFVTAFEDRSAPAFRKLVSDIAWGTFVWFVSEPDKLIAFREGLIKELSALFVQ